MSLTLPPHGSKASAVSASARIAEIEGLRGIALVLVVLFHLFGDGRVSGGVDVFLVISAFLLSRSMFRKSIRPEGPRLLEHFSTVTARLVPPAAIVLLFVLGVTLALLPSTAVRQNLQELLASALYYENWELIGSQLAYGAAGPETSPLQHFWSLAVQGQFFLVWPFLTVALVWLARRCSISPRTLLIGVSTGLTTLSAFYAFWLVTVDQPVAYFSTFARFWELGIGALLGLLLPVIHLPARVKAALAWVGLALILTCGFVLNGGALFPGPWALWPVIGTALVLAGAGTPSPPGPSRAIDTPLLRFTAKISYSLYLWHWPVLIFYIQLREQEGVSWKGAILVLGASVALAILTQMLIERPVFRLRLRISAPRLLATASATAVVVFVISAVTLSAVNAQRSADLAAAAAPSEDHIGALALTEDISVGDNVAFIPSAEAAEADLPPLYSKGCVQNWRDEPDLDEVLICESDIAHPTRTIIMSGGSHVLQWYEALSAISSQENWAIVVVDKDGCRLVDPPSGVVKGEANEACLRWNEEAMPTIIGLAPDAVFTVGTRTAQDGSGREYVLDGQVAAWRKLSDAGIPVIAVRDTPRFTFDVPECVSRHVGVVNQCGADRDGIYAENSPLADIADLPNSVVEVDLSDAFCSPDRCDPVVGNVLAYRDDDHMTATYSQTLAPELREYLEQSAGWLF